MLLLPSKTHLGTTHRTGCELEHVSCLYAVHSAYRDVYNPAFLLVVQWTICDTAPQHLHCNHGIYILLACHGNLHFHRCDWRYWVEGDRSNNLLLPHTRLRLLQLNGGDLLLFERTSSLESHYFESLGGEKVIAWKKGARCCGKIGETQEKGAQRLVEDWEWKESQAYCKAWRDAQKRMLRRGY